MKKIIINKSKQMMVLSIILVGFFASSCNEEEFLTENPKDAIYAENLYNRYSGFKLALNALNRFVAEERAKGVGNNQEAMMFKLGTDNHTTNIRSSWTVGNGWYVPDFVTSERPYIKATWDYLYKVINSANLCISRAENPDVDWEGVNEAESEANKNYVIAHAKLVWAWAYRHLTYNYGAVPLSKDEINGLNYRNDWTREPVSSIRSAMEEYLLFAEAHLPEKYDDASIPTKAVARHYLAELYLAMDRPEDAEDKALLVANDSQFKLITERYGVKASQPGVPFMDQFYDGNALPSQGNTEALWVTLAKKDVNGTPQTQMRRGWITAFYNIIPLSVEMGGRGFGQAALTAYAWDVYDDPNDDRFSEYALRKYLIDANGDTIWTRHSRDEEPTWSKSGINDWYCTRKWDWVDPEDLAGGYQRNCLPYIRLAETYLLLAEAQMKNDKKTEAAEWINKLRRRANATEISPSDVTIEFILDERSRELVSEEHRPYTLKRLGLLYSRTMQYNKGAAEYMQPHNVLYPIPQSVIDANSGAVIEQNPGY